MAILVGLDFGRLRSPHAYKDAADIRVEGMTAEALANAAAATGKFARSNTYISGGDVHVDQNTSAHHLPQTF